MIDVADYIKRAAQRTGYKREFFVEKNLPTQPGRVLALPLYGDYRSTVMASTFLMRSLKEHLSDRYLVVCTWPGMRHLFPSADEIWTLQDESAYKTLAPAANNLYNASNLAAELTRSLTEVLDVITHRDLRQYYDNRFTKKYWDTFKEVSRFLPEVPSANISAAVRSQLDRKTGKKVIVYPVAKMYSWQRKTISLPVPKEFWTATIKRLIKEGYEPIVYQNWFTYDMSRDFADDCTYLVTNNMADVLAAFRHVGLVLDVHSGISRLAALARCPFLAVTERVSFIEDRDYEFDDLCCVGLPKQYIFSFSTMLMTGGETAWNDSLLDNVVQRLKDFVPAIDYSKLPSTNESYQAVSYDVVRNREARRMGVTFIGSARNK